MASYYVNLVNDGAGVFTPAARRAGTAASGGTALTLQEAELFYGGSTIPTSTKLIGLAFSAAFRAIQNDYVTNPTASYYINIVDDGAGNFTPAAKRNATASSGGTALTVSNELFAGATQTTTKLIGLAYDASKRACLNDRATNG